MFRLSRSEFFSRYIKGWLQLDGGTLVTLIKPQFEAGREEADKGKGVIRDPAIHARVLGDVLNAAQKEGFAVKGLIMSPLEGPKGNREFLAHFVFPGEPRSDLQPMIKTAVGSTPGGSKQENDQEKFQ